MSSSSSSHVSRFPTVSANVGLIDSGFGNPNFTLSPTQARVVSYVLEEQKKTYHAPRVVILSGPGAGKSTVARMVVNDDPDIVESRTKSTHATVCFRGNYEKITQDMFDKFMKIENEENNSRIYVVITNTMVDLKKFSIFCPLSVALFHFPVFEKA